MLHDSGPSPGPRAAIARRATLEAEARRLRRRRSIAEAVAARCEPGIRGLRADRAEDLRRRIRSRCARLLVRFHRTIDALVAAGGLDEAMNLLLERRAHPRPGPSPEPSDGDAWS